MAATTLGPQAEINGDVVVVGGVLRRDPAARINGEVKEIGLGEINFWPGFRPSVDGATGAFFGSALGSLFALVSTLTRLAVMSILASIVLLFARDYVERVGVRAATEPVKAGAIGLLIQLLFLPVLIASIVLMVITIIGIPLLLLVPFGILAAVLLALVGFTAVAYDVGRFAVNRLGAAGVQSVRHRRDRHCTRTLAAAAQPSPWFRRGISLAGSVGPAADRSLR